MADDSASSKGVSRGDNAGTKGSTSTSSGGYNSGTSGSKGGGASTQSPGAGSSVGKGAGTVGNGNFSSGPGGQRGAGSNYGAGSGRPGPASMGGDTSGSRSLGGGNKSGVGGPGAGGMGAENARRGSSTSNVGTKSGYNASGNIGSGVDPSTEAWTRGQTPLNASISDYIDNVQAQMENRAAHAGAVAGTTSQKSKQLKEQVNQYRSPPGAAPQVPLDASLPGRVAAASPPSIDYSVFNLRGLTGPMGEPRVQPTAYGTNYQTAQMARAMYPDSIGQYSQTDVTNALQKISGALPGEAHYAKYGDIANYMNNLARVSLNQMVGGYSPDKAVAALDTTGMRKATAGLSQPGPRSAGMTENWADPVKGDAYQKQAAAALQDALFGRGVDPQAMNASNFVAAGTKMVDGVTPVGAPVNGTQFGEDGTWGNRIENRNTRAMASLGSAPSAVERDLNDRIARENSRTPTASDTVVAASAPPPAASPPRGLTGGLPPGERLAALSGRPLGPSPTDDVQAFRSTAAGTLTAPYNVTDAFGNPRKSGVVNAASEPEETILSIEDVPPEQNPIQYDPPKTKAGKAAKVIAGGLSTLIPGWGIANGASRLLNGGLSIGDLFQRDIDGYFGLSDAQKAAYSERADARRADQYDRERVGYERKPGSYGFANNAYILPSAYAPPPPVNPLDPSADNGNATSSWAQRNRNPNPSDPYTYGMGPGYNYFTYT